jgi:acyl-CoA synthetase (AMP-forming)/AMP-acid ligase II
MFKHTIPDLLFIEPDDTTTPIIYDTSGEISRRELSEKAEKHAAWLIEKGIRRGDRIGVHLMKSIDEIAVIFAISRIGAVWVNINYQWTHRQVEYVIDNSGMKILFTDSRKYKILKQQTSIIGSLEHCVICGEKSVLSEAIHLSDAVSEKSIPELSRPVDKDLAALLYTSGSTGKPKGVMISHINFMDASRRVAEYLKNDSNDRILSVLPLSAPWGMLQITTMLLCGGTVFLQPVVLASEIIESIIRFNITGLAAMPPTWVQLVGNLQEKKQQMPSLRYITSSGGKIPQHILEAIPEVFQGVSVYLTYGLTEAFRSTYLPPEHFLEKMGSLGKPCRNVDVFVIDPQKGVCGPGEQGELVHRGSVVTMGYWNDPESTAKSWRICEPLAHLIGDEKVHYSGDLVRIDEDGYFWFVDRMVSMIKCAGHRISTTEVEDLIGESGIVESSVAFGIEDTTMGQLVHVAVDIKPGFEQDFSIDKLLKHCRNCMPTFMIPSKIHVWDGLMPRNANGKIDRPFVINHCLATTNSKIL